MSILSIVWRLLFLLLLCRGDDVLNITIPDVALSKEDLYVCSAFPIDKVLYIKKFEPQLMQHKAHHMILYTCSNVSEPVNKFFECMHHKPCAGIKILYAWAHNAPSKAVPVDTGFEIGNQASKYVVLEVHYSGTTEKEIKDTSGFVITATQKRPLYLAGTIVALPYPFSLLPHENRVYVDFSCKFPLPTAVEVFAYRTHAHKLGTVISSYKFNMKTNTFIPLVKGNPQWPQAFYPLEPSVILKPNDHLAIRCTYNTSSQLFTVHSGKRKQDEMCNLYLMYKLLSSNRSPSDFMCTGSYDLHVPLPPSSDVPFSYDPFKELLNNNTPVKVPTYERPYFRHKKGVKETPPDYDDGIGEPLDSFKSQESTYISAPSWPVRSSLFGQISAVSEDLDRNLVILHRASNVWNAHSFDAHNRWNYKGKLPIPQNTVVILNRDTGSVIHSWGKHLFHMPHGLTIDRYGWVYITDVALHQVFKFRPNGGDNGQPDMEWGVRFEPGNDHSHFCKPTSVAIVPEGDMFVADGYCNSRIVHYSPFGNRIGEFGFDFSPRLIIPHHLTVVPHLKHLCVANREQGCVQCVKYRDNYQAVKKFHHPELGGRVYSVQYSAANGGMLFVMSGYGAPSPKAFAFSYENASLMASFHPPAGQSFKSPHDLHVTNDASEVFIVELYPPSIWKFEKGRRPTGRISIWSSFAIIGCLMLLPILLFLTVSLCCNYWKKGIICALSCFADLKRKSLDERQKWPFKRLPKNEEEALTKLMSRDYDSSDTEIETFSVNHLQS